MNGATVDMIDRTAVIKQFGGDLEFMQMIVDLFMETHEDLLSQVREAVNKSDGPALERSAHALKGAVANFHAPTPVEAALRLEAMGRAGNLTGASEALVELEYAVECLKPVLLSLLEECSAEKV